MRKTFTPDDVANQMEDEIMEAKSHRDFIQGVSGGQMYNWSTPEAHRWLLDHPEDYSRHDFIRMIQIKGIDKFNPLDVALSINNGPFGEWLYGWWRKLKERQIGRLITDEEMDDLALDVYDKVINIGEGYKRGLEDSLPAPDFTNAPI